MPALRTTLQLLAAATVSSAVAGAAAGLCTPMIAATVGAGPDIASALFNTVLLSPVIAVVGGVAALFLSPIVMLFGGSLWWAGGRFPTFRRLPAWLLTVLGLFGLLTMRCFIMEPDAIGSEDKAWLALSVIGGLVCVTTFRTTMLVLTRPPAASA